MRSDQRISIKNRRKSGLLENIEFAAMKHFDFPAVIECRRTFVCSQFEDTRSLLRRRGWYGQMGPPFEGNQERTFQAYIGRVLRRRFQKCLAGLNVVGIFLELEIDVDKFLHR